MIVETTLVCGCICDLSLETIPESRLAESQGGNLYPAWVKPGGISRNLENRLRLILMMENTYLVIYQVLESNGKILETLED